MKALIQARMSSKRLPGKVLMDLHGKPVLQWVVERCLLARFVDEVVVVTSKDSSDDLIEAWCHSRGIFVFRGELDDVLLRYTGATKVLDCKNFFRITADCPLIDPIVIDAVGLGFLAGHFDYFSLTGEFPDGLDCVAIKTEALLKANSEAMLKSDREHVGPYIERNSHQFKIGSVEIFKGLGYLRLTLDEPADYEFLQKLLAKLPRGTEEFNTMDLLEIISANQGLLKINSGIERNAGYFHSLTQDEQDYDR